MTQLRTALLAAVLSALSAESTLAQSAAPQPQMFAFTFAAGDVRAAGQLVATPNGDGSFTATSGTGVLSGAADNGALTLIPNPRAPGSARLAFFFYDDQLFPGQGRAVDYDGLLFALPDGYQAALYSTAPSVYVLLEATPSGADRHSYTSSAFAVTATPEPGTWALVGAGLAGLGGLGRLARRRGRAGA